MKSGHWEESYFQLRVRHGKSPSFFIFVAQLLRKHKPAEWWSASARVLSNCLELGVQDVQMFRSVGYGLLAGGAPERALRVFERVLELEASEPQSHLDLALARFFRLFTEAGFDARTDRREELGEAARALAAVLRTRWAERFAEVEWPALVLLLGMRSWGVRSGLGDCWTAPGLPRGVAERCEAALAVEPARPVGLLVWMGWDTDRTDVDLHVVEPGGNEVFYSNNRSSIGGHLSRDFTQGYGPEVYLLRAPVPGRYLVRAKFFASHQASASTGTTSVVLWSFTNLGGEPGSQRADFRTVRLDTNKQMQDVLIVELATGAPASFLSVG